MPSILRNSAIVASAGSGKTEEVVNRALSIPSSERAIITTYTESGSGEIRSRVASKAGLVPPNIEIMPWFTFLIRHGIKPYQNPTVGINRVSGLYFDRRPGRPTKSDARAYYFSKDARVYRDFASEAVLYLNELHGGAVLDRITSVFDHLFYDEIQDVSARDFELLELIMRSGCSVTVVGDPRQGTFSTTQSTTNRKFTGSKVVTWLEVLEQKGIISIEQQTHSMRCNQQICDEADRLNPTMFRTESRNHVTTGHDGVFLISEANVESYCAQFPISPQVLTWNKNGNNYGMGSRNMGDVKGLTFDRVIISPTDTMESYFAKGAKLSDVTKAKLYVALTRARSSVAIVVKSPGKSNLPVWIPAPGVIAADSLDPHPRTTHPE